MKSADVTVFAGSMILSFVMATQGQTQELTATSALASAPLRQQPTPWTVMIYGGVDSTAESYILPQLEALKKASRTGLVGEVVLLMDRVKGASKDKKILGADFDDTQLFRLTKGRWERVAGGAEFPEITLSSTYEANTGDPRTLKKFIRFAKQEFPGKRYALLLFGHGESRSACPDTSSECADSGEFEDPLFTAEISEGLTQSEAVDVLWVDTCSFGGIENAYQFRPGPDRFHAQVMLTSASLSSPAPMARVLRECGIVRSRKEREVAPSAAAFGKVALNAIADSLGERTPIKQRVERESWGCYDLSKTEVVKRAVDRLAVAIIEADGRKVIEDIRGWNEVPRTLNYRYKIDPARWVSSAHFDLYDLARRMRDDARLSQAIREAAGDVARNVDAMVLASVGKDDFMGFEPGKHGLYVVFPGGVAEIGGSPVWSFFRWYHPFDQRKLRAAFGNYDWCRDGATPGNGQVENWFELLDTWYDVNDESGGMNFYRW